MRAIFLSAGYLEESRLGRRKGKARKMQQSAGEGTKGERKTKIRVGEVAAEVEREAKVEEEASVLTRSGSGIWRLRRSPP